MSPDTRNDQQTQPPQFRTDEGKIRAWWEFKTAGGTKAESRQW